MKKILCAAMAALLLASCAGKGSLPETAEMLEKPASAGAAVIENGRFVLEVSETGSLKVTDKLGGEAFASVPEAAAEDTVASGVNMSRLTSDFFVTLVKSDGATVELNSLEASVQKDGVSVEKNGDAIKVWYLYPEQNVMHSVEYALSEDGFSAEISFADLREQIGKISGDDWGFMSISPLPYFGAAGSESDGYIVVPDGSGAIINHNNSKSSYASYAQEIYGRDPSLNLDSSSLTPKTAALPVFGSVEQDRAFAAIIAKGAAEATVYADTAGAKTGYNNVYAGFAVRRSDSVSRTVSNGYGGDSTLGRTAVSANVPEEGGFRIEYRLMSGAGLSYVDLAAAYRDYLLESGLTPENNGAPLYLGMTGGVADVEYTLGIPHKTVVPVTDFASAAEILADLRENGVEDVAVRLRGWQKGGLETAVPSAEEPERRLGGGNGYAELKASGAKIFPEVELVRFYKSGGGLSLQGDCVTALSGSAAFVYDYAVNTGKKDTEEEPCRLLAPDKALGAVKRLCDGGMDALSLGSVGETVPSDFSETSPLTREQTSAIYAEAASLAENVMVCGGNSYTLLGADYIYAMEDSATLYDLEDASVPFAQIALHGLRSFSVPPINLTPDTGRAMLKALETGSSLCYSVSAGDVAVAADEAPYAYIRDTVLGQCGKAMPVLEAVAGDTITSHERLGDELYKTGFSSGAVIYVNYGSAPAEADGKIVEAESFLFEEGR